MISKIVLRNLLYKPLGTVLSVILLMFGVGIISMILNLHRQLEDKFNNDLQDIDLVIGAKGSPLQLVLSAIYHVDAPTGNINPKNIEHLLNMPLIEQTIPLAYGDSYASYPIVGTDSNYLNKYAAAYEQGRLFGEPLEAVLGYSVAKTTGLKVGDVFVSTHGTDGNGHVHEDSKYVVVGVLKQTRTVLDKLITTNVETVWKVHEHKDHDHDHAEHEHDKNAPHSSVGKDHHHGEGEHSDSKAPDSVLNGGGEVTALLVKFRSPMALMTLPRIINENTNMQAASPVLEINRLFDLMGIGIATMQAVALAIMLISGLSIFITLYNRLKERKYELALARSMGSSRLKIFMMVLSEGILLALVGFAAGILVSRLGLLFMNKYAVANYHIDFSQTWLIPEEWYMLIITIAIGTIGSIIPAIKAFTLNISKTLANE